MTNKNGKTQKVGGRRKNSQRADESSRLVKHGRNSSVDGNDQIRSITPHSSRENFARETSQQPGDDPSGKILERLEFIENAYFQYVDGHQERLEARLAESREQKEIFRKAVQQLKQEIYDLVSTEEQLEKSK